MNSPEPILLPDLQSEADHRDQPIDAVGVKGVRYPVVLRIDQEIFPTVADFAMTVALSGQAKGTHMSRFLELLEAQREPIDQGGFRQVMLAMLRRLGAQRGTLEMRFPYFVKKTAPVSGVQSLLDYEVTWRATAGGADRDRFEIGVVVPVTSLCPCSKEISRYGAHNQRSQITIEARLREQTSVLSLIDVAERSASCEIYGLLKRVDEKFVTERAYDNPKFVEDLVRDVAVALRQDARIDGFVVEAENFESIHNHSAFARIAHRGAGPIAP